MSSILVSNVNKVLQSLIDNNKPWSIDTNPTKIRALKYYARNTYFVSDGHFKFGLVQILLFVVNRGAMSCTHRIIYWPKSIIN